MSKIIVITGASSGIGAATARRAVAAGHKVVLGARSQAKLAALVAELGADKAQAVACDVTDLASQQGLFDAALAAHGRIDAVFANAGIGATAMGTENGDPENFRQMIDVNIYGLTLTAKLALPVLRQSRGVLLLTGSLAGQEVLPGSVYGATKWFVRGYGENLRAELKGTGARVTVINPGMVDTPFFDTPKPEGLRPDDIARAVLYVLDQPASVAIPVMNVYPTPPLA
ncbi:SDR family oxidoreductase [Pseudooceanicola sp. CBS1P-1]|uniref:SDR family NAD(P)-dependent oxidoreductase n=1 Tax=Pseudooceanicola albus TaxID=2692189 RepID=A0A6L7G4X7_9RHOB|nr:MULTISPECIES: SDR family oxidoreductase [Pseudooceanicola]MBT9384765.1 SDR family oxidoreductase [Pseudooceanicola endophyticus]MXN18466.1 SDR family NAD(P)-dependent oxidoreductase [Pseudooceanicola albus]